MGYLSMSHYLYMDIQVIRDPSQHKPTIKIHYDPSQGTPESSELDPLKIYGSKFPILALDGIYIDYVDILYFKLDATKFLPSIEFEVRDGKNLFGSFYPKPKYIQVVIIPPFDNAYKKINLVFTISKLTISSGVIKGTGEYRNKKLMESKFECYGNISTFELLDKISKDTGLGLASNITKTEDKRLINQSFIDSKDCISNEIERSIADGKTVLEAYVDIWDYLVLSNVWDRYKTKDDKDKLKIWIAQDKNVITKSGEIKPLQANFILTNNPHLKNTELFYSEHSKKQQLSQFQSKGSNRIVSVYNNTTKEYLDHMITLEDEELSDQVPEELDGTLDSRINFEYAGEIYGEYDEFFSKQARETFFNKTKKEIHTFVIEAPLLGINRGDQFEVLDFDNDFYKDTYKERFENMNEETTPDSEFKDPSENNLSINTQNSKRYVCIGTQILYSMESLFKMNILAIPVNET